MVVPATVAFSLALVGCSTEASAPVGTVARLEFRSSSATPPYGAWAPVGQSTAVTIVALDATGLQISDPGLALHLADASVAEIIVVPPTALDSGAMRVNVRGLRLGAITQLVAVAANGVADSTTLIVPSVGGVYDLTTRFQTFSFETGAPSPPDCPGYTMYCTHTRAFDGAALEGTLIVARQSVSGRLGGLFCSEWSLAGCSAVKAMPTADYGYVPRFKALDGVGAFHIQLQLGGYADSFTPLVFFHGTASGDSLYGTLSWSQYQGRSPPTHSGTFVARLKR